MSIFNSTSYKAFLRDYIAGRPRGGRGEVNRLAREMDVHPTLVSQVLRGDKDFSIEQIHKLCPYLGLADLEKDFLILLVQKERAGTADLRQYYARKIDEMKKQSLNLAGRLKEHRRLTDSERAVFYSSWIYSAVRLFTSVGDGQTVDAVAAEFDLPRAEAAKILNFLKDALLVAEADGIFRVAPQSTHLEFGSPFLSRHHANWRIKAVQRSENLAEDEMMFMSPFSVSRGDFQKIRETLAAVVKSTSQVIKDSPAEDVACLNIDLFWMRKP